MKCMRSTMQCDFDFVWKSKFTSIPSSRVSQARAESDKVINSGFGALDLRGLVVDGPIGEGSWGAAGEGQGELGFSVFSGVLHFQFGQNIGNPSPNRGAHLLLLKR